MHVERRESRATGRRRRPACAWRASPSAPRSVVSEMGRVYAKESMRHVAGHARQRAPSWPCDLARRRRPRGRRRRLPRRRRRARGARSRAMMCESSAPISKPRTGHGRLQRDTVPPANFGAPVRRELGRARVHVEAQVGDRARQAVDGELVAGRVQLARDDGRARLARHVQAPLDLAARPVHLRDELAGGRPGRSARAARRAPAWGRVVSLVDAAREHEAAA